MVCVVCSGLCGGGGFGRCGFEMRFGGSGCEMRGEEGASGPFVGYQTLWALLDVIESSSPDDGNMTTRGGGSFPLFPSHSILGSPSWAWTWEVMASLVASR